VPIFVHGQIEAGRSDFDVIFRCLYERWKNLYVLSEHWRFDAGSRQETLRHIRAGLVWANGETSLVLHRAKVLARRGRRMQEFEGNTLFLFAEPPLDALAWDEYLAMFGYGGRSYPSGMIGVLHNFDGIYWEYYSSDQTELDRLLLQHRQSKSLQIYQVEFGADFPTPRNVSLAGA
jgi:hypothetical protein